MTVSKDFKVFQDQRVTVDSLDLREFKGTLVLPVLTVPLVRLVLRETQVNRV